MTTDPLDLLPCPFCGGPARMFADEKEEPILWYAQCMGKKTCPAFCLTPYWLAPTREKAAEVWNIRTPDHELTRLRELEARVMGAPVARVSGVIYDGAMVRSNSMLNPCLTGKRVRLVPYPEATP